MNMTRPRAMLIGRSIDYTTTITAPYQSYPSQYSTVQVHCALVLVGSKFKMYVGS